MPDSPSLPPGPLAGRRIAITRTRDQAGELRRRLEALGATVLELPLIRVTAETDPATRDEVFAEMGSYEWLVFTSANGVRCFFEEFFRKFTDIRALGMVRLAAVGPATAGALRELHLAVDVMPEKHVGEALADALIAQQTLDSVKILVVTGDRNRDVVVQRLHEARAIVDQFAVYRTEATDLSGDPVAADFRRHGADAILFTSSSGVQSFIAQAASLALAPGARSPAAISIGPVTSQTMREHGVPLAREAAVSDLDGLVAATVEHLAGAGGAAARN